MKILIPIFATAYALLFGYASHQGVEYFIPPLSLIVSYYLILKYREKITNWFSRLPIKNTFILYLIAALPFMLFEENINCFPPEAGGCQLFPIATIPFIYGQMVIIYFLIKRFELKKPKTIVWCYSLFGVTWEILVGVSSTAFLALPPIWFVIIFAYTFISYAYFALIPITLATRRFGK